MSSTDSLHSQANNARGRISNYQQDKEIVQGKIRRLQESQRQINSQKSEISAQQYYANNLLAFEGWTGSNYDSYDEEVENNFIQGYATYYARVENCEYSIGYRIQELENESNNLDRMIGQTKDHLSDIERQIRDYNNRREND